MGNLSIQTKSKSLRTVVKFIYPISVLLLSVIPLDLQAQMDTIRYTVSGKVLDVETNDPIPYVTVKVKDVDAFSVTGLNGEFVIGGLYNPQNTLIISCFGYSDSTYERHHDHGKRPHIYLKERVLELGEVIIMAGQKKKEGTQSLSQKRLKRKDLVSNPTQSLAAALSEVDGINMASAGSNVQIPIIHGLYGNRILILNNGLKHGFQNWGTDHAPEIDISAAHNITVYKGTAGVRFGPEALGGAIVVDPNPLYLNKPFYGTASSGFQTNGNGAFTTIEVGRGYRKWSYFAGGIFTKIGDRYSPDYSLTNSGKEEKAFSGGIRYRHENLGFKAHYSFVDQNLALLRSSIAESGNSLIRAINSDEPIIVRPFSYAINEPNQLMQHQLGKAEINWSYSSDAMLTLHVGLQLNKRQEFDVRRNAEKPIIDLELNTHDFQLEWKHSDWKKLEGIIGFQLFTQNNDNNPGTGTTPFIPNYNTLRYSGFIMESIRKGKHTYEAGLRIDSEYNNVRGRETNQELFTDEYSFNNITSSVGLVREISNNSTFRSNLGTSWRTPNMAELYSFGQHGFKTSFGLLRYYTNAGGELRTDRVIQMDDSNISPEKGYKWINEWTTTKLKSFFTVTGYTQYIENYIFDRPVAVIGTIRGPMPVFIIDQANALLIGADFTWKKNWSDKVNGRLGLSYLWSRNIKKNEPLINQPPLNINYQLTCNLPDIWKIEFSQFKLKPSYTSRQYQAPRTVAPDALIDGSVIVTTQSEIFDFRDPPNGYFLLDIGWAFKAGDFHASIEIKNSLNSRYRDYLNEMRYFADELGRNFLFTINYIFNSKSD